MLESYNKKRNFKETPEPSGNNNATDTNFSQNSKADLDTNARFVVQKHDATRLHYDFRLESKKSNVLISWAVPKGPSTDPKVKRLAILTEDHPLDYLLFEGNIPKGNYGAGSVIVWDTGTYFLEGTEHKDEDVFDQFNSGKINFTLFGQKLKGKFSMIKTSRENQWLLIKVNDTFASSHDKGKDEANTDLIKCNPESVLSGLTNDDIKKANSGEFVKESKHVSKVRKHPKKNAPFDVDNDNDNDNTNTGSPITGVLTHSLSLPTSIRQEFPDRTKPMLATLINKPFNSQDWVFEIKWDGVRSLSYIHKSLEILKIQSRNGNTITQRYPELIEPLKSAIDEQKCNESVVLDGEIVVLDKNGFPDFQSHQKRMNINLKRDIEMLSSKFPATYYIFDVLYLDGFDLRTLTLIERRKILRDIIKKDKSNKRIKISDFIEGDGNDIFAGIKKMNLEGMVAKHKLGKYHTGS
ncbi:MAG TPA: DNA polymerase ligase N-terminal domain-containing protein, partial [Phototrophicaceae bacterium]|nr:DNA polymerase ligase N-terminal domain-containing protein [Phototrophicaceae bacterium]